MSDPLLDNKESGSDGRKNEREKTNGRYCTAAVRFVTHMPRPRGTRGTLSTRGTTILGCTEWKRPTPQLAFRCAWPGAEALPDRVRLVALRRSPQQPAAEDALLLRSVDAPAVSRVTLSEKDKAQHVQLTDNGLGAQSSKARAIGLLDLRATGYSQQWCAPGVPHCAVHARRRHRRLVL